MRSIFSLRIFSLRSWLLALVLIAVPVSSFAGVFISINVAPPPLPYYAQPYCPGDGYIWTPGYWAYGEDGYFWVPGTWVMAPFAGGLWTPGFWGWGDEAYLWHEGYWGREVGFYGGVNYGYGYGGRGYEGGYWRGDRFNYNRSVNNVNITNIHNVYNKTVINNYNDNRVSYNGGNGGVSARPSQHEEAFQRSKHDQPLPVQRQQVQLASSNRQQLASVNHGVPPIAATPRPGAFNAREVVPAANRPWNGNVAAPGRIAPSHDGTPNPAGPRIGVPTNMPQRNTNPSGNGTPSLTTARPNHQGTPTSEARPAQPTNDNRNGRPQYNAPQANNGAEPRTAQPHQGTPQDPRYNPQPQHRQNAPQANDGAQPRYTPPPQRQQSAPQEPRYNPLPQRQQNAPQEPRYSPPPQRQQNAPQQRAQEPRYNPAPQQRQQEPRYTPPPQRQQSAPQPRQQSAPQQHEQSAPQSRAVEHQPGEGRGR